MAEFLLSGFGDEISPSLDEQLRVFGLLGIDYIELRGVDGRNISTYTPGEALGIKQRLDGAGIAVSAVGSPMGKIPISQQFEPHLQLFHSVLEVAKVLDAPFLRIFSFVMESEQDYARCEAEVLRRMECFVRAAQGSGVTLVLENEKVLFGDVAPRVHRIVRALEGELFVTFDPSNYVQCGQDTIEAYELLAPYIRYLHLKDSVRTGEKAQADAGRDSISKAHRPVGLDDGNVPYLLDQLYRRGYEGFVSLEPDLYNVPGYEGTGAYQFSIGANWARKQIAQVYNNHA